MRIKELRTKKDLSQQKMAEMLGIAQSTLSQYESQKREPDFETLTKISNFFGVSVDYLIGNDYSRDKPSRKSTKKIPVLGKVEAGVPIEAVQEIIDWEEITGEMAESGEFFALQINGNSMMPRMAPGDVVIVRKQPDVDSGEIAIVIINGEDATCKKIIKRSNGISLVSYNSDYPPVFYTTEQIEGLPVIILGRVVELRAKF